MKKNKKLQLIQDSALQGVAELHVKADGMISKFASWPTKIQRAVFAALAIGAFGFNSTVAWAASSGQQKCGGEAGSSLVKLIDGIAEFAMILGGGLAILMFVIGALYIIVGSKQSNVSKGIGFIKNAALGLGVLILAGFIRLLITQFAGGIGQGVDDASCTDKAAGISGLKKSN